MRVSSNGHRQMTTRVVLGVFFGLLVGACGPIIAEDGFEFRPGPAVEGIPELGQALTPLTTACDFVAATGVATVVVEDGETAILSKRVVDNAFLVNGFACSTATSTNLKQIVVEENGSSTGDEVVVLDLINGLLGTGSSSMVGVDVDLGVGTDAFKIRGSNGADRVYFGADGISINSDNYLDISYANVDSFVISMGAGADQFTGQGGRGSGLATAEDLTVYGGEGTDTVTGGDGDDTLYGGDDDDTIAGADGDDTLYGGAGDDTFDEGSAANGADTIAGGTGADVASYADRTGVVTVTIGATANDGESGETDDVQADCEGVTGGSGDDSLTGDSGDNVLRGGAGDDTLVGGTGDDTMYGDEGDDTFDEAAAASGADVMYGGAGTDVADYSARTNDLDISIDNIADDGEAGELDSVRTDVENIICGAGDDTVVGSSVANVITAGAGDDTVSGGAGDDTFVEGSATSGADSFNGGAGMDTVDYSARTLALSITMDGTADDGEASEGDNIALDMENVLCGAGADTVTGNDNDNVIEGGAGIDTIAGGAGNDTLYGEAGDDDLDGGDGDDILDGGAGTNTLDCGAGDGDVGFGGGTNCEL